MYIYRCNNYNIAPAVDLKIDNEFHSVATEGEYNGVKLATIFNHPTPL